MQIRPSLFQFEMPLSMYKVMVLVQVNSVEGASHTGFHDVCGTWCPSSC